MPQVPPSQVAAPFAGAAHASPQPPQCWVLAEVFTQDPSQLSNPKLQASEHMPAVQIARPSAGTGQALLHPPQFSGSLAKSTHRPSHNTVGGGQDETHSPPKQAVVDPHGVSQPPQ